MKKYFLFIFSVFLMLSAFLFSPNIMAAEKTVYVDQTLGSDENTGSDSAPFKSLSKALESSTSSDENLTVILNNLYSLDAENHAFAGSLTDNGTPRVTIKIASTGYFLIQGNDNAEVVFKDIDFDGDQNNNRSNPFFIVKSGTLTLDHVNVHDFCVSSQDGSFARIDGGVPFRCKTAVL